MSPGIYFSMKFENGEMLLLDMVLEEGDYRGHFSSSRGNERAFSESIGHRRRS